MAKVSHLETVLAGTAVGSPFAAQVLISFGLEFIAPAIDVTILSLAAARVGGGLKPEPQTP